MVLESGEEIAYDYLVMAVGTRGHFPVKVDDTLKKYEAIPRYEDMFHKVINP